MKSPDNTIYVGKKPTMNYVLATVTLFNGDCKEVVIKARGRAISKAVDVAEIVRHRFVQDAEVKNVAIDTEEVVTADGEATKVSSIEIFLHK